MLFETLTLLLATRLITQYSTHIADPLHTQYFMYYQYEYIIDYFLRENNYKKIMEPERKTTVSLISTHGLTQ